MKKTILNVAFALLISAITFSSCSKKAKEESKEATEAVSDDAKEAATDVKEGAEDVATDVKDATKEAASDTKEAVGDAVGTVESKVSKLSASARTQYDAFTKEIERLDEKIKNASAAEKVKFEKTKATFVAKRDALLAE